MTPCRLLLRNLTVVLGVVLSCWVVGPVGARADGSSEFRDLIKRAVMEFELAHWAEANALFRRAHALDPSARTWRGLGITSFELRRYVDAIAELEAALADPRKPLTSAQRGEARRILRQARDFVSVYRIRVAPEDAEVLVDGQPAELSEGVLKLDPGPHHVTVRAPGYQPHRTNLDAAAGEQQELSIELELADGGQDALAPPDPAPTLAAHADGALPRPRRRVWTWALASTAAAAGAVGLGLGLATKNKHDDLTACREAGDENCRDFADKGQGLQLGTNLSLGLAGAALAGAVVAFFLEGRERPPQHARPGVALGVGFGGVAVDGRF